MSESASANNKRIAKNTLLLYVRMLFLMAIGLYTSRVVLRVLGVEDYGVYNVVGGFVGLFAVLSQSLSSAASRFLTYAMGAGDEERLKRIFSSTVVIHIILALIILIVAEIVGVWFVNNKMVIDPERLSAANWVFQFSVLLFCVNLLTVPYNAAIIAHEEMGIFAYISIFEGVAKLIVCYLILYSPYDKLVFYAVLILGVQLVSRGLFYIYSKCHYLECTFYFVIDKPLLKELFSFAGWNMIGSTSAILRNQGGNVLINLFYGPVVNAARAIANQVLTAVNGFVENFMVAVRPQITKSYAKGEKDYMMSLIFRGSRLSYYMLLIICLPIFLNTDYILCLWLHTVPDFTTLFVRLTLTFTMIESLSYPLVVAQQATGNIRNYQIIVGGLQMMNLPFSYVFLKLGCGPEVILYVAIFFGLCCLGARLLLLRKSIHLSVRTFGKDVLLNIVWVSLISFILPSVMSCFMRVNLFSFVVITIVSLLWTVVAVFFVGCTQAEQQFVMGKIKCFKENLLR